MENIWPIIIVAIISIISSLLKKAKEQQNQPVQPPKTTRYDKPAKPVITVNTPASTGGLADLLREFQKIKEAATQNKPGFPTPAPAGIPAEELHNDFPEPVEDEQEIYREEEPRQQGMVSMDERIATRENALKGYEDADHPIFKGAGTAGQSRITNQPQSRFLTEFGQKENLLRAIVMNEVIFNRKG